MVTVETIPFHQITNRDKDVLAETIYENPYVLLKPYKRQLYPIINLNRPLVDDEPNTALIGAGGYGGKTVVGTILAAQYLEYSDYQCLVTRKNRKELIGPDSIWQNLKEWVCDPGRLGDLACTANKSELTITAPSGATVWFKYFDGEDTRQKIKSESYSRIINDEASELKRKVLQFFYRSLRNSERVNIPLALANLSNPGGPATDYLCEEYVDGPEPYFPLDWRHNPFINKRLYGKTLNRLDYVDIQYQKHGDWHYRPAKGDLFPVKMLRNRIIDNLPALRMVNRLRGVDFNATKAGDRAAFVLWQQDERGHNYILESAIDDSGYPEDELLNIIERDNPLWKRDTYTTDYYFEKEGGSSGIMAERYIEELLEDYIEGGLGVEFVPSVLNKFARARPMGRAFKQNRISILKNNTNDQFIEELGDFGPDDKEYDYDDQVDGASIGFNALHIGGNPLTETNKRYDLAPKKEFRNKHYRPATAGRGYRRI